MINPEDQVLNILCDNPFLISYLNNIYQLAKKISDGNDPEKNSQKIMEYTSIITTHLEKKLNDELTILSKNSEKIKNMLPIIKE